MIQEMQRTTIGLGPDGGSSLTGMSGILRKSRSLRSTPGLDGSDSMTESEVPSVMESCGSGAPKGATRLVDQVAEGRGALDCAYCDA